MEKFNQKDLDRFIKVITDTFQIIDTEEVITLKNISTKYDLPLNSITFIKLIVNLENEFNVDVEGSDLEWQNYETLEDVFKMICKLRAN